MQKKECGSYLQPCAKLNQNKLKIHSVSKKADSTVRIKLGKTVKDIGIGAYEQNSICTRSNTDGQQGNFIKKMLLNCTEVSQHSDEKTYRLRKHLANYSSYQRLTSSIYETLKILHSSRKTQTKSGQLKQTHLKRKTISDQQVHKKVFKIFGH